MEVIIQVSSEQELETIEQRYNVEGRLPPES